MKIGALGTATGTKVETIRYYEKLGLLGAPDRTVSNYRSYGQQHLQRLSFIRRARALGFSLDNVRELLDLADDRTRSCEAVDAIARQHLAAVDEKVSALQSLRKELGNLIDQCGRGSISHCLIIEALGPTDACKVL